MAPKQIPMKAEKAARKHEVAYPKEISEPSGPIALCERWLDGLLQSWSIPSCRHGACHIEAREVVSCDGAKGYLQGEEESCSGVDAIVKSAVSGRYATAYTQLLAMDIPPRQVDASLLERVNRIGEKFTLAKRLWETRPEDMSISGENSMLKLKWGVSMEGNIVEVTSISEFHVDFFKMLALDLQLDTENMLADEDFLSRTRFSTPHAHDCCWRVSGPKSDDYVMVSSVDALDTLGAVCSLRYTLDPSEARYPSGTPLPALKPNKVQTPCFTHAAAFTPLVGQEGKIRGVRKHEVFQMFLSANGECASLVSSFVQPANWQEKLEKRTAMTAEMLKSFEDPAQQSTSTPYSDFIKQVRGHLATSVKTEALGM